jgi:glycosyltransferase involved in cell wall biosynthesis
MPTKKKTPEISIILPCRNEEKALDFCLTQVKKVIKENNLNAEVIVSDSSTDSSPEIALKQRVILVKHNKEGYGNAYLEGLKYAKGKYIFMADADGTYDFAEIPKFTEKLKEGYDFILGDRFKGKMEKNAMSWTHKYIGNPALSSLLRLFFKTKIHDVHCGMRMIKKDALERLDLKTTGMEFASEMIIQALKNNLKIKEIPINYYKRRGKSKLNSIPDGWRHLRFMLLYSPMFLFFIPGIILILLGFISGALIYFGADIFGRVFFYHPIFLSSLCLISGYQFIIFFLFAKTYAINNLGDKPILNKFYKTFSIESGSILGLLLVIGGIIIYLLLFSNWIETNFGNFEAIQTKNAIVAFTLIILGVQTFSSSFMLSILGIKNKNLYT